METSSPNSGNSKIQIAIGWIVSLLPALLLCFSASMKLSHSPDVGPMMKQLGWDFSQLQDLAILELTCVVVYLIPWTSVTGAILMTGYMGGAMATHLRVHEPPVVQMIVPIVAWLGLWLREPRLRAILPWRG